MKVNVKYKMLSSFYLVSCSEFLVVTVLIMWNGMVKKTVVQRNNNMHFV